jgi:hypothetical protein
LKDSQSKWAWLSIMVLGIGSLWYVIAAFTFLED